MQKNCKIGQCIWSEQTQFCTVLKEAKVPNDGRWPLLILYLRGIREAAYLSELQKARMQELLKELLRLKDFSQKNYEAVNDRIYQILTLKLNEELREFARETSQLARDITVLFGKRQAEVANMAEKVDEDLARGVDPASLLAGLRDTLKNVAARMEQDNDILSALSHKDSLTGLDNRRSLDAFLADAVEIWLRDGPPLSLVMFDIDHFKHFNDTYGHLAGDQVLATVARQVEALLEPLCDDDCKYLAARYGGEEFAVVLLGLCGEKAVQLGERIRRTMEQTVMLLRDSEDNVLERKLRVTVSVGVATARRDWPGAYQMNLLDFADKCLYQAKRYGRNCTVRHAPGRADSYVRVEKNS